MAEVYSYLRCRKTTRKALLSEKENCLRSNLPESRKA